MGKDLKLLTPENADHAVTVSPDGRYFVDVYSTVTQPQTAVVRDDERQGCCGCGEAGYYEAGGAWMGASGADCGEGAGWEDGLVRLHVQADGLRCVEEVSDCELMCIRGRRRALAVGGGLRRRIGDWQSLAELGFIVVCIDGMGTPLAVEGVS